MHLVLMMTEEIRLELVFQPGPSQLATVCAPVPIANDTVVEDDQVRLIVLETAEIAVTLRPASARLTIIDDDGMLTL